MKTSPNTWWNSATGDIDYCAEFMRIRFTIDSDWRRMSVWIYRVRLGRHWVSRGDNFPCYPLVQSLNWLPGWVMWPMGLLFYDVTVDIQIWALLTRSQCRSSLFLTLILVFLHRIEQLKALVFDSSSDTSSSSPDSSCHHKRLQRNIGNTVHPHRGQKKEEI